MNKIITIFTILLINNICLGGVINGVYIGGGAGLTEQSINLNQSTYPNLALQSNKASFAMRADFGYNLNDINGFEVGNTFSFSANHTNVDGSKINISANSTDLSYLLIMPGTMFSDLSAFARIGIAYSWLNPSSGCGCGSNLQASQLSDVLGLGLRFRLDSNWSLRGEWLGTGIVFPVKFTQGNWHQNIYIVNLNYHF